MTRIAFAADLHVDQYGSRVDPDTGLNGRLVDYLRTLRWVALEAAERDCEALVIAGDFTERRHPAPWLVSRIRDSLAAGPHRQVYLRGNHDGEVAGGSIVSVLDDGQGEWTARTGVNRPSLVPLDVEVVIACIPYLDRHWLRAQPGFEAVPDANAFRILAEQFLAIAQGLYAEAERDYPDAGVVLVCHQTLAGAQMSPSQQAFLGDLSLVVDARALQAIGYVAVVAGHLHRHQVVIPGDRPVLYAGSIERVDYGEEGEAKGFLVADVGPGRFEWQFVETPARRFVTLRGDGSVREMLDGADVAGAVVRVVDLRPELDAAKIRGLIEDLGAFEVASITKSRIDQESSAAALPETLTAEQALSSYFDADPDRDALLERGRELVAAAR